MREEVDITRLIADTFINIFGLIAVIVGPIFFFAVPLMAIYVLFFE